MRKIHSQDAEFNRFNTYLTQSREGNITGKPIDAQYDLPKALSDLPYAYVGSVGNNHRFQKEGAAAVFFLIISALFVQLPRHKEDAALIVEAETIARQGMVSTFFFIKRSMQLYLEATIKYKTLNNYIATQKLFIERYFAEKAKLKIIISVKIVLRQRLPLFLMVLIKIKKSIS